MGKMKNSSKSFLFLFLFLFCSVAIPTLHASPLEQEEFWKEHSKEFDEYWKDRAHQAAKANQEEYHNNPYEVVGNITATVDR